MDLIQDNEDGFTINTCYKKKNAQDKVEKNELGVCEELMEGHQERGK